MSYIGELSLRSLYTDDSKTSDSTTSDSTKLSRMATAEPIDSDPAKILSKSTATVVADPDLFKAAVDVYKVPSKTAEPAPAPIKTAVAPTPSPAPSPTAPVVSPGAPLPPPPVVNVPTILPPGAPLASKKLLGLSIPVLVGGGAGLLALAVLLRRRKK